MQKTKYLQNPFLPLIHHEKAIKNYTEICPEIRSRARLRRKAAEGALGHCLRPAYAAFRHGLGRVGLRHAARWRGIGERAVVHGASPHLFRLHLRRERLRAVENRRAALRTQRLREEESPLQPPDGTATGGCFTF